MLSKLGPFELQEVLSLLSGSDICRIMTCGCKSFNNRIVTTAGVRNLTIVLPVGFRQRVWPSFVNQFESLYTLAIEDLGYHYTDSFTSQHLLSLSSRPSSLKISGKLVLHAFIDACKTDSSRYNNLVYLSLLSKGNPHPTAGTFDWPPNLTYLQFSGASSSALDLCTFPPALTELSASCGWIRPDPDSFLFPASLTTLELFFSESFPLSVLHRLPKGSNLTKLNINFIARNIGYEAEASTLPALDCNDAESIASLLPQSLTSLCMKVNESLRFPLNRLPPKLVYIRGLVTSPLCIKKVFSSVTETLKDFYPRIPASEFAYPPLEATDGTPSVKEIFETRGIVSMRLDRPLFPQQKSLLSRIDLPTSLKELMITYAANTFDGVRWSLEGPIVLPPGLTSLLVLDGYRTPLKTLEAGLPPNLLHFSNPEGFESAECLKLLPKAIISIDAALLGLRTSNTIFPIESSLWLPPSLTSLSLGPIAITSLKWFNGLPNTLVELRLALCKAASAHISVPDHSTEPLQFPVDLELLWLYFGAGFDHIERIIEHLPRRKLQSLRISHNSESGFTNQQIPALPRLLLSLVLSNNDNLTEECQPYLPPRLAYLSLGFNSPVWFSADNM